MVGFMPRIKSRESLFGVTRKLGGVLSSNILDAISPSATSLTAPYSTWGFPMLHEHLVVDKDHGPRLRF